MSGFEILKVPPPPGQHRGEFAILRVGSTTRDDLLPRGNRMAVQQGLGKNIHTFDDLPQICRHMAWGIRPGGEGLSMSHLPAFDHYKI
jgi:hypothetical protein